MNVRQQLRHIEREKKRKTKKRKKREKEKRGKKDVCIIKETIYIAGNKYPEKWCEYPGKTKEGKTCPEPEAR